MPDAVVLAHLRTALQESDGDCSLMATLLRMPCFSTTMGIVRRQLARINVPQREQVVALADVRAMRGAVVMNSWTPGVAVSCIGQHALPPAPQFVALLHQAYRAEPLLRLESVSS